MKFYLDLCDSTQLTNQIFFPFFFTVELSACFIIKNQPYDDDDYDDNNDGGLAFFFIFLFKIFLFYFYSFKKMKHFIGMNHLGF